MFLSSLFYLWMVLVCDSVDNNSVLWVDKQVVDNHHVLSSVVVKGLRYDDLSFYLLSSYERVEKRKKKINKFGPHFFIIN